jgi:hypothetical protein
MPFDIQYLQQQRFKRTQAKLVDLSDTRFTEHRPRGRFERSQRLAHFFRCVTMRPDGCWEWSGTRKPKSQGSYPIFTNVHAIAWAYRHVRGLDPPTRGSGQELVHQDSRDNPLCKLGSACVNPAHVEPSTHTVNMRYAASKRTHCRKGHPTDGKCKLCRRASSREWWRKKRKKICPEP